jgi:hypothetical protein
VEKEAQPKLLGEESDNAEPGLVSETAAEAGENTAEEGVENAGVEGAEAKDEV